MKYPNILWYPHITCVFVYIHILYIRTIWIRTISTSHSECSYYLNMITWPTGSCVPHIFLLSNSRLTQMVFHKWYLHKDQWTLTSGSLYDFVQTGLSGSEQEDGLCSEDDVGLHDSLVCQSVSPASSRDSQPNPGSLEMEQTGPRSLITLHAHVYKFQLTGSSKTPSKQMGNARWL